MGNINHSRKNHMLMAWIIPEFMKECFQFFCSHFSLMLWNCHNFVSCIFYCTSFMNIDMSCFYSNDTFIGF